MDYQEYVLDVFMEDQNSMGLDLEEIQDIIEETPFTSIEKWLLNQGYELWNMYLNDCEK
jgi:hypothetical protein